MAALAARKDPAEELEFAVTLINRVVSGVTGVRLGVHVCRGNWSRDETTLLRGNYQPLAPSRTLARERFVLVYATERASDLLKFENKELGLGVVNPRTDTVETSAEIRRAIERALRLYAPEQIFLNPDCGFGTFSSRPINSTAIAVAKLQAMATPHASFAASTHNTSQL